MVMLLLGKPAPFQNRLAGLDLFQYDGMIHLLKSLRGEHSVDRSLNVITRMMSAASSQVSSLEIRQRQVSQAQRTAEAKAAFTASLLSASTSIDTDLQERAKNIHANDKVLTKQENDVRKETKKLAKQNDTMQKFVDKSTKQLAAFDNLESVHADLENDLADIEEMLRLIEEEDVEHNDVPSAT